MSNLTSNQEIALQDITREKSLYRIYLTSRQIPFSWLNISIGLLAGILTYGFSSQATTNSTLADALASFASTAFSLSVGQLGFLLAGFSFFATMADREMLCRMAEKIHQPSQLSYLKYTFLVFMRVFVEFLIFAFACLALMIIMMKGVGFRESISKYFGNDLWSKKQLVAATLGLYAGSLFYLLMQLSSFIYNIYHVVMATIRWALKKEYELTNAEHQISSPETNDFSDDSQSD